MDTKEVLIEANGLTFAYQYPSYFERKIEVDEWFIESKQQLFHIFSKELGIPFSLIDDLSKVKLYLLNKVTVPTVIIWHNYLVSLEYLDDYLLAFCRMLKEVRIFNKNLHIVGF